MLTSISYKAVPQTTAYNIAVFLLGYSSREDGLSLGEAFCQDFDIIPDIHLLRGCNATALKMIARDYLS